MPKKAKGDLKMTKDRNLYFKNEGDYLACLSFRESYYEGFNKFEVNLKNYKNPNDTHIEFENCKEAKENYNILLSFILTFLKFDEISEQIIIHNDIQSEQGENLYYDI